MRKRFSEIRNCRLLAVDGAVGNVTDLLLDDQSWNVRYLVVELDQTLLSRRVLISPAAIQGTDFKQNSIATLLDSQQLADSPIVDWNQPVSRQYEEELVNHYGWPIYWLGRAVQLSPQQLERMASEDVKKFVDENGTSCLRSAIEICGYDIESNDGPAGVMKDLIVNTSSWKVDYGTAEPSSWLPSDDSMFSTHQIESVDWAQRSIEVDLSKAVLEPVPDAEKNKPAVTGEPLSTKPFRLS